MKLSQEYISALVILIVSLLNVFGIEIANEAINGIIVGVLAIWCAVRRYQKKDITIFGAKR